MTKPSFVLRVTRANQLPAEVEFDRERVTVGRETADLALRDPGCSSKHAEILFAEGAVKLRDVGSTNGTWRGTTRVTEELMAPGAVFTLGGSTIELLAVKGVEVPARTLVMPGPRAAGLERGATALRPPPALPVSPPAAAAAPDAVPASAAQRRRLVVGAAVVAGALALALWQRGAGAGLGAAGDAGVNGAVTGSATVKAVWFRGPEGPHATGGTSATTVRVRPNDKQGARVGVVEQFAGGAGNQWRTAAWLAAFSSSRLTGRNLVDHEFLVETGGQIDGPSAGMLITATMIALLRGRAVRADTTMTGTINPDGSAGPVGGIVQKLDGAKRDGITRFGFPMGTRSHVDLRTGHTVDLVDVGRELGIEVREIHDVFEAYEFLTGDTLARPPAVAEAEMELDGETTHRLRTKNAKWTARLRSEIANIGAAARGLGALGKGLEPLAQQADLAYRRAQEYERSDFLASAFDSYVQAAVFATITKERARFLKARDDADDLLAHADAAATVEAQIDALAAEVELHAGRARGGAQIDALRASQALVAADAFAAVGAVARRAADELLQTRGERTLTPPEQQELQERLYRPVLFHAIARTLLDVASDQRDLATEQGPLPAIPADVVDRAASAYASAAGAVLAYLESLAGARLADGGDDDYLVAMRAKLRAERITGAGGGASGDGDSALARLAAGSLAFLKGASLVNKYYSLGGEVDADGNVTLTNRKALIAQLALGRQLAREAAAKAKRAVGFVPIAARLAYQLGVARREGDDKDKLKALEAFWESAFWSELAANARPRKR